MDYFEDVFWFTEEILSRDLKVSPGKVYNMFIPDPLSTIRSIKELYFSENLHEKYWELINNLKKEYESIT